MALLFGLRNATVSHLVAQCTIPSPANNEFVGMIESITKSLHSLLTEGLESEPESDPGPSMRRLWRDSMMLSIIPTNSLFAGDGIVRCATRWLTVIVVLWRPNGSTVGALRAECSREGVRRCGSSLDGWGLG